MRLKNLKTGLEGQVNDLQKWERVQEITADHRDRIYYCTLKREPCRSPIYKECVYHDVYQVIPDKE